LEQLERALSDTRKPSDAIVARTISYAHQDVIDLLPVLEERAREAIARAEKQLAERAAQEAASLENLLRQQRSRIERAEASFDDRQLELAVFPEAERRQLRADRAHWQRRLERIECELEAEPVRVKRSYEIRAQRLEPVGLVYLWPASG
jgi:hypothetical protein